MHFPVGTRSTHRPNATGTAPPGPSTPHRWARSSGVTNDERNFAVLIHILSIVSSFLAPLILWLIKRDESAFVDHHGKEALNFQITMFIAWSVTIVLVFVLIGLLLIPVLLVIQIVFPIMAGFRPPTATSTTATPHAPAHQLAGCAGRVRRAQPR